MWMISYMVNYTQVDNNEYKKGAVIHLLKLNYDLERHRQ